MPPRYTIDDKYKTTLVVNKRTTLILQVKFIGWPTPKAKWTFNKKPVPASRKPKQEDTDSTTTLSIPNVDKPDSGPYTCSLENPHGASTVTITVKVTGT